jgi:pimeloyl-ACP methyl ester carboxylesterase
MAPVHHVTVAGTRVEVEELGAGATFVVIQTALAVRELEPLARELSNDVRVWHVRRPGYGASGPARAPGSVASDADLVAAVLGRFGAGPAHVLGASYSAAVAISLAARHPDVVRSLTLVEPPPHSTPGAAEFRSANEALLEVHARLGAREALEQVMRIVDGPDWRTNAERDLPGSVADMERDADTFFTSDVPALLGWQHDDIAAATIDCSTLLVGGGDSHPWFGQMLDRLDRVLAQTRRVTIAGAGHSVAVTHPVEVASAVRAAHVRRVSPGTRATSDGAPGS